jgi:DNA-binding transcriptional LysR family regulator
LDRLDTLRVLVAIADLGSFVDAARQLRRSPAAISRAVAELEVGARTQLLIRTTRSVALTEAGTAYVDGARRVLAAYDELEGVAGGLGAAPSGWLTVTAPEMFGRLHLLPIAQAFMCRFPQTRVSLLLLNRVVSLVEEGIDLGLRIAHLPDSSLRAIRVGAVHRIVCASPDYLATHGTPTSPRDLAGHRVIAVGDGPAASLRWAFTRTAVGITPVMAVNTVQAALDAAAAGGGVIRVLSYQTAALEASGRLVQILRDDRPPAIPIHLVHPAGRYPTPKVSAFIDTAVPVLRQQFDAAD